MKPFQFRFERIEQWKETVRDEKRDLLAEAVRLESDLLDKIAVTEEEIKICLEEYRKQTTSGEVNVDRLLDWRSHEHQHRVQLNEFQQQLELVRLEIERRRECLIEADQDVKVVQKLLERDFENHRVSENRKEQNQLNEFAQRNPQIT